jgi:hypothetical protein
MSENEAKAEEASERVMPMPVLGHHTFHPNREAFGEGENPKDEDTDVVGFLFATIPLQTEEEIADPSYRVNLSMRFDDPTDGASVGASILDALGKRDLLGPAVALFAAQNQAGAAVVSSALIAAAIARLSGGCGDPNCPDCGVAARMRGGQPGSGEIH